jgi:hypothetical protein
MKFSAIVLASLVSVAAAGKPRLSIHVRDGKYKGLDALDPTLTWEDSSSAGDIDLSYGVEASARPTSDLASLPRNVWGKASTDVSGWGVSARAEVDAQARDSADLELDAANEDLDLSLKLTASAGGDFAVQTVQATKGFDRDDARVTVTPRFNLETDDKDVEVNYSTDKTNVKLTASADEQEVTISQQINDDNRIAPTVNSRGDISVEWERRISDDSSLTANLKPDDSLDFEWKDSAWTANVNMPIKGTDINGANVSIKRDVNF